MLEEDATATAIPSNGTLPYIFSWSDGQTSNPAIGLGSGTISLTVTDALGASSTGSCLVKEPPPCGVSLNTVVSCTDISSKMVSDGTSMAVTTGGKSPYTYKWSDGQTTQKITGLPTGSISVTVTDAIGCKVDDKCTVNAPTCDPSFSLTLACSPASANAVKDGISEATPSGGNAPYTYLWSDGQTSQEAIGLPAGLVSVTITDAIGCELSDNCTVIEPPPCSVAASVSSTDISCFGMCDGTLTANELGGISPYTYLWSSGETTKSISGVCLAGNYTVTITENNGANCYAIATATVKEPSEIIAEVVHAAGDSVCGGAPLELSAMVFGGVSPYSYDWGSGFTSSNTTVVNPLTKECYSVSITDFSGCKKNSSGDCVEIYEPIVLETSDTTICSGQEVNLFVSAKGGNGFFEYEWEDSSGIFLGIKQTIKITPKGKFPEVIKYVVSAKNTCPFEKDTIEITFFEQPTVSVTPSDTVGCYPFSVIFYNTSFPNIAASCTWALNNGKIFRNCDSLAYTFSDSGIYLLDFSVVTSDGCESKLASPSEIRVSSHPVADFKWKPEETTTQNMFVEFEDKSTGSPHKWEWTFFDNSTGNPIGSSQFMNPSFDFSSADENSEYIFHLDDTGSYPVRLIVTNDYLCADTIIHSVYFKGQAYFNIANAFTPNGDGLNDTFFPKGIGIKPDSKYRFTIFNRWGETIFLSRNLSDPWDGTSRDADVGSDNIVEEGIYVWRLEFEELEFGKNYGPFIGRVTLVKSKK